MDSSASDWHSYERHTVSRFAPQYALGAYRACRAGTATGNFLLVLGTGFIFLTSREMIEPVGVVLGMVLISVGAALVTDLT